MAKKFLTPLGLVGLASDPATGSEGQLYFNTTDDVVRVYANGEWTELSGAGGESASVYYQTEAPEGAPLGALWVDSDSTGTGGSSGGSGNGLSYWSENENGDLIPDTSNLQSIGSSAFPIKELYISGSTIYLGQINLSVENGELNIDGNKVITELNADENLTDYLTITTASSTYATKTELNQIDLSSTIQTASAAAVTYLVDSAPGTLDTLNELSAALNDDPNFYSTIASVYLTQSSASATYLTQEGGLTGAEAAEIYLTQSSASTTYATKTEVAIIEVPHSFLLMGG
jgi:hypothetical protein